MRFFSNRDHPYITSAKDLGGWVKKSADLLWGWVPYEPHGFFEEVHWSARNLVFWENLAFRVFVCFTNIPCLGTSKPII